MAEINKKVVLQGTTQLVLGVDQRFILCVACESCSRMIWQSCMEYKPRYCFKLFVETWIDSRKIFNFPLQIKNMRS